MAKANVIEYSKKPDYKGKKPIDASSSKLKFKGSIAKKYDFPSKCIICNKEGHYMADCKSK